MEIIYSRDKQAGFIKNLDGKTHREELKSYLQEHYSIKEIFTAKLIHSDTIFINERGDGDGIIVTKAHTAVMIYTADCFSVVIRDKKKSLAGIFHSGWRGTELNIVGSGIQKLQSFGGQNLTATIFPGIHRCCFEIGAELVERFTKAEIPIEYRDNKIFADLKEAIKKQIIDTDIKVIEDLSECTCCDETYYSYRRDKTTMRNLSFVVLGI